MQEAAITDVKSFTAASSRAAVAASAAATAVAVTKARTLCCESSMRQHTMFAPTWQWQLFCA
jgi:hypothetical protein